MQFVNLSFAVFKNCILVVIDVLLIIKAFSKMEVKQVLEVYSESTQQTAKDDTRDLPYGLRMEEAEQRFLAYLRDFLQSPDTTMVVWEVDGVYKAALRVEPYLDGWLITGLETAPTARRCGYGAQLVKEVLNYLRDQDKIRVYSHVDKRNAASLSLHYVSGFKIIADHAVYLDGSVFTSSCTLCYEF